MTCMRTALENMSIYLYIPTYMLLSILVEACSLTPTLHTLQDLLRNTRNYKQTGCSYVFMQEHYIKAHVLNSVPFPFNAHFYPP